MIFLTQLITWINFLANVLAKFLFAPIAVLPGWLSITVISAIVGVLLLVIFKYTSNQTAIGRVRSDIKADMLIFKLFKDSLAVTLSAQGRVFKGAFLLLFHAIVPMLVMIIPVSLVLAQMGSWYQFRPLQTGEHALVTLALNDNPDSDWPNVSIQPSSTVVVETGPVRIFSKREINWEIKACENGDHNIVFLIDGQKVEKSVAIGEGFMRLSPMRPGRKCSDILLYPLEKPFAPYSPVQSISIDYPNRPSRISGTDWWIAYFFVASMALAFLFKPLLKVKI